MSAKGICGLVLAGGESRRMGSDKALLSNHGQSQLSRAVALLERHLDTVFVSARENQAAESERSKHKLILDRYHDMGPLAGILSAMDFDPAASWLVLACDLPRLDDSTIVTLISSYAQDKPFTAYQSTHDGLPEPLCAIYSPSSRAVIDGFVADGLTCPRKILIRSDSRLLMQPDPRALDNMNTPADLEGTGISIAS